MLEVQKEHQTEKKSTPQSTKNQTKLIKPNSFTSKNQTKTIKSNNLNSPKNNTKTIKPNNLNSSKNQTKTIKSNNLNSTKNQTKTIKSNNLNPSKNQTKLNSNNASSKPTPPNTSNLKKLNSTTTTKFKKLNSTSTKKPIDLAKASNKTTKSNTTDKKPQTHQTNKKPNKQTPPSYTLKKQQQQQLLQEQDEDDDDDEFVSLSEFRDLPNKFHRTLLPDLETISTTSKAYITKANNEMTKGFKPYVGKKYASTIATIVSSIFMLIPLLLVSLLCNKIKTFFSLQKILIIIQIYLSIYFTILCISTLFTGIEPLKFLFSTSQSTYICFQILQTLGYVFYLLLLVVYLVLVFSTECGLGSKFLGLGQIFVGFSVGLHYYVTVFHKVVLRQPPKSNWKIHGIYAMCFLMICLFAGADRRKKAYVENDGGEGKKN
ncbi:cell wall integrity/stress response component protein [Trifolium repens]|nr:cell wall integrity/stress response component protein [Trifolium repens]